jgi:hypothetical protein
MCFEVGPVGLGIRQIECTYSPGDSLADRAADLPVAGPAQAEPREPFLQKPDTLLIVHTYQAELLAAERHHFYRGMHVA